MAYYNANRVIKLTRKALGLTQEKLSEGICEVETYSRIENGHRTIRRSTYQKLMEKMGRITDRRYAICVSKDGMLLDEKIELERAYKRYDYEAAEKYLEILKEKVDDNLLTKQYMARVEALIAYRLGKISAEELVEKLDFALRMTVPDYEQYLDEGFTYPFTKMELLILMNLGNVFCAMKDRTRGRFVYQAILRCLNVKYLGERDNMTMQVSVGKNVAKAYTEDGNNAQAIGVVEECLEVAIRNDYGCKVITMLVTKAHNYIVLAQRGEINREFLKEASKCLRQAYYVAAAREEYKSAKKIRDYYNQHFEGGL